MKELLNGKAAVVLSTNPIGGELVKYECDDVVTEVSVGSMTSSTSSQLFSALEMLYTPSAFNINGKILTSNYGVLTITDSWDPKVNISINNSNGATFTSAQFYSSDLRIWKQNKECKATPEKRLFNQVFWSVIVIVLPIGELAAAFVLNKVKSN